jgi:glycosyltransferase involved in cell wall biosynthesis
MKVLMVSGDRSFGPGHPRYELQRSAVEHLAVVYWGRGALLPSVPKEAFDIVTVQDPFWRGLFAWRLARRLGARFNVQVHADLDSQSFIKRFLARYVLRRADSVRVVSEKLERQVEGMGVRAPIHVLPIFVDVPTFSSVVRREHAGKNILWIGRFEEEKDPILAITILKGVLKIVPDARLVMLGDGSLKNEAIKRAANLPVVEILGRRNPITYLDTADVVLCTSKEESWGAVIIEALAAGVPVVAPDVGVAREAGAIVVPRERMVDAVIDVLKHGAKGELKLTLPSAEEWARRWKESLA